MSPKLSRNQVRDKLVNSQLRAAGRTTLRLWEHTIRMDLASAVGVVRAVVLSSVRISP